MAAGVEVRESLEIHVASVLLGRDDDQDIVPAFAEIGGEAGVWRCESRLDAQLGNFATAEEVPIACVAVLPQSGRRA
jgi:hypothetical protein